MKRLAWFVAVWAVTVVGSTGVGAYVTNGVSWSVRTVPYWINTTNLDLPESSVEPAVRAGADVWATETQGAFNFQYSGRSGLTTTAFDNINLVVFRNASNGSAIATTYWWSGNGRILDADVVFWDAGFRFFSGSSGCSGGFYIEDIAAHEFGHALGLGHSASSAATMYPTASACNPTGRTLDADDIAGVRTLYPPLNVPPGPVQNLRIVQ